MPNHAKKEDAAEKVLEPDSKAADASAEASETVDEKEAALIDRTPGTVGMSDDIASAVVAAAGVDGNKYQFTTNENGFKRTFPEKLMEILDQPASQDIMHWMPDGEAFCILSSSRCRDEILPKFFKQTKFPSFVRKLNRWGFKQISKGTRDLIYRHPLFKRNRLDLCQSMRCMATSTRASIDAYNFGVPPLDRYPPNFQQVLIPSAVPGHPSHMAYLMQQYPFAQIPGMPGLVPQPAPTAGGQTDDKDGSKRTGDGSDDKAGESKTPGTSAAQAQIPYPYAFSPYYQSIPGLQQHIGGVIPVPYFLPVQAPLAGASPQDQAAQINMSKTTSDEATEKSTTAGDEKTSETGKEKPAETEL